MRFVFVDYIPGSTTPARVYRSTGVVLINRSRFDHLPEFTKKFILKHEEGHYKLNTTDEFAADEYASNALLLTEEGSLKKSIEALDKVLPKNTPEQNLRISNQVKRALQTDANLGNKEAEQALKNLIEMESNYEGTYINPLEDYSLKHFVPSAGRNFNDILIEKKVPRNEFLNWSADKALGFEKVVPEKFIERIDQVGGNFRVYENGINPYISTLPKVGTKNPTYPKPACDTVKNDVTAGEHQNEDPEIDLNDVVKDLGIEVSKNEESQGTSISLRITDRKFYFLLGVITVLVFALVVNLLKK